MISTVLGLTALMSLTVSWTNIMPQSYFGFARMMLIYIPLAIIGSTVMTSGILARVENWAFADGFYFMIGHICGLATPLTHVAPGTAEGCLIEALTVTLELCFGGAVIGIIGAHPITQDIINLMEGRKEPRSCGAVDGEVHKDSYGAAVCSGETAVDDNTGLQDAGTSTSKDVLEGTIAALRAELARKERQLADVTNCSGTPELTLPVAPGLEKQGACSI